MVIGNVPSCPFDMWHVLSCFQINICFFITFIDIGTVYVAILPKIGLFLENSHYLWIYICPHVRARACAPRRISRWILFRSIWNFEGWCFRVFVFVIAYKRPNREGNRQPRGSLELGFILCSVKWNIMQSRIDSRINILLFYYKL